MRKILIIVSALIFISCESEKIQPKILNQNEIVKVSIEDDSKLASSLENLNSLNFKNGRRNGFSFENMDLSNAIRFESSKDSFVTYSILMEGTDLKKFRNLVIKSRGDDYSFYVHEYTFESSSFNFGTPVNQLPHTVSRYTIEGDHLFTIHYNENSISQRIMETC